MLAVHLAAKAMSYLGGRGYALPENKNEEWCIVWLIAKFSGISGDLNIHKNLADIHIVYFHSEDNSGMLLELAYWLCVGKS